MPTAYSPAVLPETLRAQQTERGETMGDLVEKVDAVAYHRNGVGGESFNAVLFTATAEAEDCGPSRRMLAIVCHLDTDDEGEPTQIWNGRVFVLALDKLLAGDIGFGSNSWRGDRYETELRPILNAMEKVGK
jgi:hypothetical protein